MKVKIVIPSMSRSDTMTTHKLLTGSDYLVCVPESQVADYTPRVGAEHILAHPEGMGKVSKQNWCFDNLEYEALLFLDDDILSLFRCWRSRISDTTESTVTDPEFILTLIEQTATMCRDLGAFLFGWSNSARHAVFYTVIIYLTNHARTCIFRAWKS